MSLQITTIEVDQNTAAILRALQEKAGAQSDSSHPKMQPHHHSNRLWVMSK